MLLIFPLFLTGCFSIPLESGYKGPPRRPASITDYYEYKKNQNFSNKREEIITKDETVTQSRINITTEYGALVMDYFKSSVDSDDLVLVFPILGGRKNMISGYFADYFARNGIDSAIVHRDENFKNPECIDELEDILRNSVIRDRIAIDYFETIQGKKKFASFGISRGAINVAITSGIDSRLEYNVMALGGTNLVKLFSESKEGRIKEYRQKVQSNKNWTQEEFVQILSETLKTDPVNFAQYIDARKTLLVLSLFDDTVPIKFGKKLRHQIGKPETIYLLADHKLGLLYTGFVPIIPPIHRSGYRIFPIDYLETEALHFYRKSFGHEEVSIKHTIFQLLQIPFVLAERTIRLLSK